MDELKWLVGAIIAAVGAVGGLIVRDRAVHKAIKEGDEALHSRVNDVRKEYVRRDDFEKHANRMEKMSERIEKGIAGTHKRIDDFILKVDK